MAVKTRCTADTVGQYECGCAECAATTEAELRSEALAEIGAGYAYSGFSAADAMTMASNDLRAIKLRAQLPDLRKQYGALRRQWAQAQSEAEAADLWARAFSVFMLGYEATGTIVRTWEQAEREFAANMRGWVYRAVREGRV